MVYTQEELSGMSIHTLRVILRSDFNGVPGTNGKQELIKHILKIQSGEEIPVRSTKGRKPLDGASSVGKNVNLADNLDVHAYETGRVNGVFEKRTDGFGYVVWDGLTFSKKDVFVRASLVESAQLETGDYVEGVYDGCGDVGGYVLKGIDFINGKPVVGEETQERKPLRMRPVDEKVDFSASEDYLLKAVDLFCPLGKGQRCLISSDDNSHSTDLIKRIVQLLKDKNLSFTLLLIGAKPEVSADFKENFESGVFSVDFKDSLGKAVRVCNLAVQSASAKAKSGCEHVLIIDRLSSLSRLLKEYLKVAKDQSLHAENGVERFILDTFCSSANYGDGKSLTVLASLGDLDQEIGKSLFEVSNAVIKLKGEGKIRKRFYKIDVANSWSENDAVLHGEEKIAKIDELREEICQNFEKEDEIWQQIKSGEIKI